MKLDSEYGLCGNTLILEPELNSCYTGTCRECDVDDHIDHLFKDLASCYKGFVEELTNVAENGMMNHLNSANVCTDPTAERDIGSIRLTQDFSSQRSLNLTTIATFFSSVTATTLQITTNYSATKLVNAANALWFISLIFSTASAVYSLLTLTWYQSSM